MKIILIQGCSECNYYYSDDHYCRELNKKLYHCFENFDEDCPLEDMSFNYYTTDELIRGKIICPHCNGTGRISVVGTLKNEEGFLCGTESLICSVCNGKGKVTVKLEVINDEKSI